MKDKSLLIAIALQVFLSLFNFTSPLMASDYVVSDLGGANEIAPYETSFFGLGVATTFLLGIRLEKKFGTLRTLAVCNALSFCFLLLCGLSPNFFTYVFCRFLSGVALGPIFPLGVGFIAKRTPPDKKIRFFATLACVIIAAPSFAASYGGWLAYDFKWSWVFYLQLPLVAVSGLILQLYAKEEEKPKEVLPPFDLTGFIFFLITAASSICVITLGEQLDWFRSPTICFLSGLFLMAGTFFVLWEWNHEDPFIELTLCKKPIFLISNISLFVFYASYFGSLSMLSIWLHIEANYTPLWIALLMGFIAVAVLVLFFFLERFFLRTTSLETVLYAAILTAIACFYSATFDVEVNFGRLALARILYGAGLAFFLFPIIIFTLREFAEGQADHIGAILQTNRYLAGSIGSIGYTTMWFRRQIFYHDRLGEQLTPYSQLTSQFFSDVAFYGYKNEQSISLLGEALDLQSSALALADSFYFMGWTLAGICLLLAFYLLWQKKERLKAYFLKKEA
jgi:DHA2 family multidrug resistance protein